MNSTLNTKSYKIHVMFGYPTGSRGSEYNGQIMDVVQRASIKAGFYVRTIWENSSFPNINRRARTIEHEPTIWFDVASITETDSELVYLDRKEMFLKTLSGEEAAFMMQNWNEPLFRITELDPTTPWAFDRIRRFVTEGWIREKI